jgi:hypothetical protein
VIHPRVQPLLEQVADTFGGEKVITVELSDRSVWVDAGRVDLGEGGHLPSLPCR